MPTVPRIEQLPSGALSPTIATPPAGAFEGMPQTQKAGIAVLSAREKLAAEEKKKIDKTVADENEIRFYQIKSEGFGKATALKGKDAIGARDVAIGVYDEGYKAMKAGITDPGQLATLENSERGHWAEFDDKITRYIANELDRHGNDTANALEKIASNKVKDAKDETEYTVERERLAAIVNDRYGKGTFIAQSKFEELTKEADRQYRETAQSREVMAKSAGIWLENVKDQNAFINIDTLTEKARKTSTDPKVVKGIITDLKERFDLHNQAIKERDDANTSAIWDAYDKGAPSAAIRTMPEYQNLSSGEKRIAVMDKLDGYAEKRAARARTETREAKADLRIEQEIYRETLAENPILLKETDLEDDFRGQKLSESGYKSMKVLKDPQKQPAALAAFKRLDDAKRHKLFNSEDADENTKRWVAYTDIVHTAIANNPDVDLDVLVDKIMEPVTSGFLDRIFSDKPTVAAKQKEIEEMAGQAKPMTAKPAAKGKLKVKSPNGKTGYIPVEQLAEAIKTGYTEVK